MFNPKFVLTVGITTVALALMTVSTQAFPWGTTKVNHLTFSKAVALPGVVLPAGAYTFEAGADITDRNIVRVRARNGQGPVYQGYTREVRRSAGIPRNGMVSFGEAPTGQPTPIVAWYETYLSTGHEFLYR